MSEKRFILKTNSVSINYPSGRIFDNKKQHSLYLDEVVFVLNEQQATIRKLQDLCGESDYENAKLRIENKSLQSEIKLLKPTNVEQYEQIVQLQEENEQLQAQLREKEQDERLYANEIVELRKTNEEWLQFKELGGDY